MLEIERKRYIFRTKQIWFSDTIYNVTGYTAVVFSGCKTKLEARCFQSQEGYTSVIDLTQSLDTILKKMDSKSCRYAIRRAERDGIKIEINQNYDAFYRIYQDLGKHKGLLNLEKLETIKKYGILFTASVNDEIIGGHVYFHDNNTILYWISATARFGEDKTKNSLIGNASHLIHWHAIQYAKRSDLAVFDMGGLFAPAGKDYPGYSIDDFKRSFGGEVVKRYQYQRDYSRVYRVSRYLYNRLKG